MEVFIDVIVDRFRDADEQYILEWGQRFAGGDREVATQMSIRKHAASYCEDPDLWLRSQSGIKTPPQEPMREEEHTRTRY